MDDKVHILNRCTDEARKGRRECVSKKKNSCRGIEESVRCCRVCAEQCAVTRAGSVRQASPIWKSGCGTYGRRHVKVY